ncbi:Alkaline phosphatase-like, alpha/beta/alpha [Penicillium italicum]|uniref:Alkaline phosphatase-like, alpha/beta/alpha n=1 Tax=Penicillium italicum TaxID=40296 RepID=A0A0A2LEN2_PENIT|nr:Alkaline phosphatase-like, alpha/beta/alpha [Penicillium italicum]
MNLILSGLIPMATATTVIAVASWLMAQGIWNLMSRWLCSLANLGYAKTSAVLPGPSDLRNLVSNKSRFWTLVGTGITIGLWLIRPSVPYNHMTGALPFTMLGEHSRARRMTIKAFPLPELLAERYREPANGHYKGWAPTLDDSGNTAYGNNKPAWARGSLPAAFERWIVNPDSDTTEVILETSNSTVQDVSKRGRKESFSKNHNKTAGPRHYFYNPVQDPMRISNLDLEPLGPLQEALKDHAIPINHIVFVFLESARKDLFPLKNDSRLYNQIRESHVLYDEEDEDDLYDKLSQITPVAEMLTGEQSGFGNSGNSTNAGLGGLSCEGILSGSSLSAKSRLVNYCGLGPLPVDFMHENDIIPYQPCLMHIMDLFNQRKKSSVSANSTHSGNSTNSYLEREWQTIYAQSVTGEFQAQTRLMDLLGFNQTLYSEDIDRKDAKYFHEEMKKINYFGYAETEARPYIKDLIDETLRQNKRLFLSHFTSTTHHPWGTPEGWNRGKYFGKLHSPQHEPMDKFLNANRFVDTWLGDLMDMLGEAGIADETLTVFVGDHGQSFAEDCPIIGTYHNPHISNFRVPLVFHHPLLPRMHLNVNGSAVSILPTILDLLVNTNSLNADDTEIALDLMNEYEGQSLIRPYRALHNGREAWNMGVINAGGSMLSVGSAAVPWRLNLPLNSDFEYRFTDLNKDPYELDPITDWTMSSLAAEVHSKYGAEAFEWAQKAEKVGLWWVAERKKLWNYSDPEE